VSLDVDPAVPSGQFRPGQLYKPTPSVRQFRPGQNKSAIDRTRTWHKSTAFGLITCDDQLVNVDDVIGDTIM
jgi:hypothetical protein